ncbi:ATP-binding cassette domain-containing protein [Bradyrhizobium sp. SZCCHNRI3043]|uniref:ATP-binding cassette domain-containing protein n=1 Tax=Bradyrhizobium sp. SZCCHNRI3043 TaxID=3057292 RepID=UPI0028E797D0|nr:ATP-binding cassette domain-containing protein [Bradyrhizobium sp. SZCCHNRI3043]
MTQPKLVDQIEAEIRSLVENNDLRAALERLRLLIIDCAPALKDEVTHLFSRLNRYERAERLSTTQTENINDISIAILKLLKQFNFGFKKFQMSGRVVGVGEKLVTVEREGRISVDTNELRRRIIGEISKTDGGSPCVSATEITKSLGDGRFMLGPVSLELRLGQISVVCGDNGSGKTTLLRLITGNLRPSSGDIKYFGFGRPIDWLSIKAQIAFVSSDHLRSESSVKSTLEFISATCGKLRKVNRQAVDDYLARYNLEDVSHKNWSELSAGFLMRVDLVRCLLTSPRLIVLDEPLAHLDFAARATLLSELKELTASFSAPASILLSTHHVDEVDLVADQIIILRQGRCEFVGARSELYAKDVGSSFQILGGRGAVNIDQFYGISGIRQIVEVLGGVQLTFNEKISIAELIARTSSVDMSSVRSIVDVSFSAKKFLLDSR